MHEQGEKTVECTSSRVKRWAYTVMDWCCPLLGIEAMPGTHMPSDFDVDVSCIFDLFSLEGYVPPYSYVRSCLSLQCYTCHVYICNTDETIYSLFVRIKPSVPQFLGTKAK